MQKFQFGNKNRTTTTFSLNTKDGRRISRQQGIQIREPFEILPRHYTISTNNTSATFNTNILFNSSSVLKDFHQKNPDKLQYHIEIEDNKNVLSKIEQIFQGKQVILKHDEYSIYYEIRKILNLIDLPRFPQSRSSEKIYIGNLLEENIRKEEFLTFTIKTNKSEYKCNIIGVILSSVIQELLEKDPTIDHFDYDYDDENGEFGLIRDFFNFKSILPTRKNAEAIKEIAEDLKIDLILNVIDDFSDPNKEVIDLIDEQQETIDENKEIFELLYNIKKKKPLFRLQKKSKTYKFQKLKKTFTIWQHILFKLLKQIFRCINI